MALVNLQIRKQKVRRHTGDMERGGLGGGGEKIVGRKGHCLPREGEET